MNRFHPHGPDGGLGRPDARDAVADNEGEDDDEVRVGDCDTCGDLTGMPTTEYWLPEHNGVDAYPVPGRLCSACAYELAEKLQEWTEAERAHARKCGARIPGDPHGSTEKA